MARTLPRSILCASALAALLATPSVRAQSSGPVQIDRNGVLILLRTTLLALDAADKTGNYTVFRDLAAPGFASANNAARLAEIFAGDRRDGLDLSGVAVLDPQLTALPEMRNGMMHMAGFFPSVSKQVNFELLYQPVNGQWRLFGISLNVGPSGPVAPSPPPLAAMPPAGAKPPPSKPAPDPGGKERHGASH